MGNNIKVDANNVVELSVNMAPHQSNSVEAVGGVSTIGISHKADGLSGNDIEGAINIHSEVGNVATSHGNSSFVKELGAVLTAVLNSDGDNSKLLKEIERALRKQGIEFSIKQK